MVGPGSTAVCGPPPLSLSLSLSLCGRDKHTVLTIGVWLADSSYTETNPVVDGPAAIARIGSRIRRPGLSGQVPERPFP
jgi:hypothetical protein